MSLSFPYWILYFCFLILSYLIPFFIPSTLPSSSSSYTSSLSQYNHLCTPHPSLPHYFPYIVHSPLRPSSPFCLTSSTSLPSLTVSLSDLRVMVFGLHQVPLSFSFLPGRAPFPLSSVVAHLLGHHTLKMTHSFLFEASYFLLIIVCLRFLMLFRPLLSFNSIRHSLISSSFF